MKRPLGPDGFQRLTGLDAATVRRLSAHLARLERWQRAINLVSAASLGDPWRRHVLDSAQLVPLLPAGARTIVDLGSGAGFPGLVIAVISGLTVELVESDARKCAFLAEAARITGASVRIRNQRIETVSGVGADVVTARACAPLPKLLGYARQISAPDGCCLFLKGKGVEAELTESRKTWMMRATCIPSRSDTSGTIVRIEDLGRRNEH